MLLLLLIGGIWECCIIAINVGKEAVDGDLFLTRAGCAAVIIIIGDAARLLVVVQVRGQGGSWRCYCYVVIVGRALLERYSLWWLCTSPVVAIVVVIKEL